MSLGATISRLRAEQNLSQEALADALGVSRQSVSKWETDGSVPELDKLVKLSEIFGVTLDHLVRGEQTPTPIPPEPHPPAEGRRSGLSGQGVAGVILLCMGFLVALFFIVMGSLLGGLLFASPLLACGVICLTVHRRAGLWCGWVVYLLVDAYLRYATGISWQIIRLTPIFEPQMNYMRLATGWGQFLAMVLLVVLTVFSFRKVPLKLGGKGWAFLLLGWAALILVSVLSGRAIWPTRMYALFLTSTDNIRLVLLTALLTATLRAWRTKKAGQAGT